MAIIDAQLHIWEAAATRPWDPDHPALALSPAFTIEDAIATMDANGVRAALLDVLPAYRTLRADGAWDYDNSYADEARKLHPGRFAATLRIDPAHPQLEDLVAQAAADGGTLALRLVFRFDEQVAMFRTGGYDRLLRAAERCNFPVMLFATGHLDLAAQIARNHPSTWFIIDHLGLPQSPRAVDSSPWRQLPGLLALASLPNVAVKCIGSAALSLCPFPYPDIREPFHRMIDAFGASRLMWGSDHTRLRHQLSYAEQLASMRDHLGLSESERAAILGGTLTTILDWPQTGEV